MVITQLRWGSRKDRYIAIESRPEGSVSPRSSDRIPTLDGWRGIAILLVVVAHFQSGYFYNHPFHGWAWLMLGKHGVAIFFVLSGYLITSRLFRDGDPRRFYVRRFFRLMPVAWTYLICVALLGTLLGLHLIGSDAISCLLFYRNFWPSHETQYNALTSHFWSLSVEEQFYLVWPTLLFALRRLALALAVLCIAVFSFFHWTWPYAALFVGCTLAFASKRLQFTSMIGKHYPWLFPLALLLFGWCLANYHDDIPLLESTIIAVMLACTSLEPNRRMSRPLEWKFLVGIGICSYSIYVWQELFLITRTGFIGLMLLPFAVLGSYYLIELPARRLGTSILERKSRDASLVGSSTFV